MKSAIIEKVISQSVNERVNGVAVASELQSPVCNLNGVCGARKSVTIAYAMNSMRNHTNPQKKC